MKKLLLGLSLLFLLAAPCLAEDIDDQAISSAFMFVSMVDDGNWAAAYWSGSPLLQLANPEQEWLDRVERRQKVLGRVLTRELKAVRSKTSIAHLPDDNYRVILFDACTTYKAKAYEALLLHQVNGIWQVCSYKIH